MNGHIVRTFILVMALLGMTGMALAQNSKVTASVQPALVTVGDTLRYEVAVEITGAGQPSVAVPVIRADTGLSTPSPAGQQSSVETYIENGNFRSVQKIIYVYSIQTSKAGSFTIPPATVTLNGRTYETESVRVTVQAVPKAENVPAELEGLVAAPNVPGNSELQRKLVGGIFVLPVLSKTDPYNGEQVRISYHLVIDPAALQAAGLQLRTNLEGVHVPQMNEFITEELFPFPQDLKFQERKIGGRVYLVSPVYEAVIASTKTGKLQIEPFQISMFFNQQGNGRQRQLPAPFANDPFFSSMAPMGMFGGSTVQVIAQSPQLSVDVKPLPEQGKPATFNGAVGDFEVTAAVDRRNARAYDDTVSLTVKVEGEGNAESLSPPTLPSIPGFTVLGNPTMQTSGRKDGDRYISAKTFEYTLRPTTPGKTEIPPVELPYFDPADVSYKTAASDAINMEIAPGTRPAPAPTPAAETENEAPGDNQPEADLRYVSTEPLKSSRPGLAWMWGPLGVVLFMMPPVLVAAAGLMAARRSRMETQVVDQRKVARNASQQHMREAARALDANDSHRMAAELAEGMRLHFAALFGITTGEVTIPAIEERLGRAGAPAELIDRVTTILETCDGAQYAPAAQLQADARQMLNEAQAALKSSEKYV